MEVRNYVKRGNCFSNKYHYFSCVDLLFRRKIINGFSVNSTKETLNIEFDRNIFNDDLLSEILDIIEVNCLSKLADIDESILNIENTKLFTKEL